MLFNNLMEGESIAANKIISSINFNTDGKEHGTIKALLKNFILPEAEMAIKQKHSLSEKCVYTVPIKPPMSPSYKKKMVNDAKQAFLNSTIRESKEQKQTRQDPTLHYAQIAITTSDDTRSTGGGIDVQEKPYCKEKSIPVDIPSSHKKRVELQQRKVSFKIKNASTLHRRLPLVTTMTITSSKVSELTKKFNDLVNNSSSGSVKQSKLVKTFEDFQSACSASSSSTPSSTLSSSPNIKIVVQRHRRGSRKRNSRKRCSSMDSIDKLILSDSANSKIRIIRSKSDGNRIPKSPKKRLKYPDSNGQSGSDSVDGSPSKIKTNPIKSEQTQKQNNVVKNVIKKFECEINAQSNQTNTWQRNQGTMNSSIISTEKPKVPEKKSSLVVTKNLVLKDGVPKIKTIKPVLVDLSTKQVENKTQSDFIKKKEPIYDKKKFKTNYIHSEKLPLHVVEIIQEEGIESSVATLKNDNIDTSQTSAEEKSIYQDIENSITPNESFLWRRKNSQTYSDCDKSYSETPYGLVNVILNESSGSCQIEQQNNSSQKDESQKCDTSESQKAEIGNNLQCESSSDFESNLIEAYNREVLIGFTLNPPKKDEDEVEDDYEVLEPCDDNIVVVTKKSDRTSKINCPLPEIPKEVENIPPVENVYQCLLEMRSHPEGDESSLHNYETCGSQLEERTRGDGDSDDGYEYCKSPVKPYCHTSSSGIQIAENYNPSAANNKNYTITKSVSGTSTVSYEKIGSDRIYERIPPRPPKSKESSPKSKRDSIISDYNDTDNIYDTIKHPDGVSLSHCYESIPNSPSMIKLNTMKRQLPSAIQKRLSFDNVSNISHSTISSEQKTNSIYGQRSVLSYNGQELVFQVPSSETSVSDRSDRSDDWIDISDEEKTEEKKIIIVQERSRKKGLAWSQKVRHQWQNSPKQNEDKVSISSPTKVYINTNEKCPYYSANDREIVPLKVLDKVKFVDILQQALWLDLRTILRNGEFEVQDLVAFIECDSSDSGHLYESLEPAPAPAPAPAATRPSRLPSAVPQPIDDDFDSFDSDTDDDDKTHQATPPELPAARLPTPPHGGQYTLTKIASAAQKKMRQIKRNLTKRYSVAMDGKTFIKSNQTYDSPKNQPNPKSSIYANYQKPEIQHLYSNINFEKKTEKPLAIVTGTFRDELKTIIDKKEKPTDKRLSSGDPPPLPEKPPPEITTSTEKKDSETLSRKAYFSFKSRFRRATSMAVDINSEVPSALKITNSTFYLTDSMDGDSGFSNCSDNGTHPEVLSPTNRNRRDGTRLRPGWAESSPCLALERPTLPPPPPPQHTDLSAVNEELKRLLPTLSRKEKGPRTRTSWYAECGSDPAPARTSNASWYAEAGVYPAGHISSSSGASSGSHPASPRLHSLFTHEPLYQFYNAAKVESACGGESDSDTYEAGGSTCSASRPSAMALIAPRGPARTLWCEVPEVLNSTVLSSLAPAQKKLQEAKFEVLTSEASYLNSLNVLEEHFISHPAFREAHVLPREDWETLFSTILPVRKCSQMLLADMERCWQENILLTGICDIVRSHADRRFHAYVKYCENQALMVRTLQRLKDTPHFSAALKQMESHPACQSLSLHSFLMLPMQRITRLPLLLDAVLRNLSSGDDEYDGCMHALATLNNFVSQCNEGARNTERLEEMFRLSAVLHFPPALKHAPNIAPACDRRDRKPVRWLVRSGEMTQLVWKTDELKLTFGKKFHKLPLHLFLFNDHLIITKKKSEDCYVAIDHCPRSLVDVCSSDAAANAKYALLLTLLENHEGRTIEMLMSCASETDARRWTEALAPPTCHDGEAVYAGWDCPQVAALYAYTAAQPDELGLNEGDIVNVTRKTSEGWYYGERTRDGESGWFPGSYTVEIASPHVRARNLRQRYRLLALSGTYLGQKKRPT